MQMRLFLWDNRMILCTALIGFSTIGIAAAAVSRNIDLNGMNMMYNDSHNFIGETMKFLTALPAR